MPNFETYQPATPEPADQPYVTITTHGEIKLSKSATQLIGQPRKVELHYDRMARVVGISPAVKSNGIPLRVLRHEGLNVHGHTIARDDAVPFLEHFNIDHSVTRRYPAYVADGVLCLDLVGRQLPVIGETA